MATTFSADNLRKLLRVNSYPFSETAYILFGIRGAASAGTKCEEFRDAHAIKPAVVNYAEPRCLLGIWNPVQNQIALFPGSTVPHLRYIKGNIEGRAKCNCMMSGYYNYYEKGYHNPSPASAHQALRLATNIGYRRSYDDYDFTNTDLVEVGNPNDNLHAAYTDSLVGAYSSAGCQVIVGQPKCQKRGALSNTSYWKKFYDAIYHGTSQQRFAYALFRCADAAAVAAAPGPLEGRLRFGSQGSAVLALQNALERAGFFYTNKDGAFGRNTLQAVLAYQTKQFGEDEADGVVGRATAAALRIQLPMI
ncbi:MAG TPA: peptidoglycan-binding domain-containing protein [Hymenobacter sp.]|uniref:peptidoglycan-binding domain-containing protein n=1 Tax=Hymenobacter sp. TaxID=1898978 RepID=UPI002EDBAD9B